MEWKDEYSVEVQEIDDQHKSLFQMVGRLETLIGRGIYQGPEIDSVINFLKVFTVTHFKFEEMCMSVRKCPMAKKNLKAHDAFLKFVGEFELDYRTNGGDKEKLTKMHGMLSEWLTGHICKIDQSLKG